MSDIREMLEETVAKLLKDHCSKELITQAEQGVFPVSLWKKLEELGVTSVAIEEENGGSGGDLGDFFSILKLTGYYAAPIPYAEHILSNWFLTSIGFTMVPGITTFSQELSQDVINFNRMGDTYSLNGTASFVPWGRDADFIIVIGMDPNGNKLAASIPLQDCEIHSNNSLAGEPRNCILLKNVEITLESVKEIDPIKIEELLNLLTLTRVMMMTGALERVLELSVSYSKERIQFGKPISKFQAIQQQLAILAGEVTASMAVADYIVNKVDRKIGQDEVAMAKIQLGDAAEKVTRIAHQVHAAMGFTDEHPLHQSTRRLWSWREECGAETTWAKALGQEILTTSFDQLWPYITSFKE
ncbi:acyl-CoA dehydrogenase family protein [Bacillus pinisoli]|uniref:acyl-CoA dehydrogenase family protein n=1 Tax=Bacillus pinisoli TaxID=2901866 RepID=UPI001FF60E04|nr:acyl-CoA dehydrogenase family protein [Bacillus pinisoli]